MEQLHHQMVEVEDEGVVTEPEVEEEVVPATLSTENQC